MSLHITPEVLAAAYEYLRTTLPFRRWDLPPAEEVEFRVSRTRSVYAEHFRYQRVIEHVIRVSGINVHTTNDLLATMAHEMIHAGLNNGPRTLKNVGHSADFRRRAKRVCAVHGWELMGFIGP